MRAPVKLRRPVAAAAVALALVAGAVGCSSSSGSSDSSTTTTSAAGGATTTTSAPGATGGSSSGEAQGLMGLLLTAAEIGSGFSGSPQEKAPSSEPSPCGSPSPNVDLPPVESVEITATNAGTEVAVSETIHVYPSAAEATGALALGTAGLSCGTGTSAAGEPFSISAPIDLTAQMGTEATGWDVTLGTLSVAMVVSVVGDTMVTVEAGSPNPAALAAADTLTIAQAAVTKFMAG